MEVSIPRETAKLIKEQLQFIRDLGYAGLDGSLTPDSDGFEDIVDGVDLICELLCIKLKKEQAR
jgi:hypothetical protein